MPLNTKVLRSLDSYQLTTAHPRRDFNIVRAIKLLLEADHLHDALRRKLLDAAL